MQYKTKPPKKCEKCKKAEEKLKKKNKKKRRRRKPNPERSKERLMFFKLDDILVGQEYIRNGYYSWLMSPKNQPMQMDIYYPGLKLAFE